MADGKNQFEVFVYKDAMQQGIQIQKGNRGSLYLCSGYINEYLDMSAILDDDNELIILDLRGIKRINSIGTNIWIEALQTLLKQGKRIEYHNCSIFFMDQCHMVRNLCDGIYIHSFEIELVCDECDLNETLIINASSLDRNSPIPEHSCQNCGKNMIPENLDFFDFLKTNS
ncbi:hypothetical protein WDW89_21585 [Deltaproteobacteria bacterium TL4]